ncbi:hypothetical protein L1049_017429 [Liquidambar formosana]|uniref:DUF4005 domain-containing protein n=1 Tax=Liquidambar formosana TaxID=63359 RepID=A0AAP0S444_LIQFO
MPADRKGFKAGNRNARNMGKKGSWFSCNQEGFYTQLQGEANQGKWISYLRCVRKQLQGRLNSSRIQRRKARKKRRRRGLGKLRHGEATSFIPLFREPSSIEKILGDAEREHKIIFRPPTPSEQPNSPLFVPSEQPNTPLFVPPRAASPRAASPRAASPRAASPRVASPRVASPRVASPRVVHHHKEISYRPEPTVRNHHVSATRIQAAYRGYMARRSFRALRGLVRLQGVVRGQNVKRQTMNAMKYMQLLVRVQSQIQSRRIQMLENQALQRQAQYKNDKEVESTFGKWTLSQTSEAGNHDDWDDSLLTKEQIEARLHRKVEAVIKRERAMAYAYSHQQHLWKATPKSAQTALMDIRSGGFPWWWSWLERQLPPANPPESQAMKNVQLTPPRPNLEPKPSPRSQSSNYKQQNFGFDNMDLLTPRSSKSTLPPRTKHAQTPTRMLQTASSSLSKYSKPRTSAADSTFDVPLKDDDSLMSCPPFSAPNYMAPTVSAKAKVRAYSNPRERFPTTPSSESKRRLSVPFDSRHWVFQVEQRVLVLWKGFWLSKNVSKGPVCSVCRRFECGFNSFYACWNWKEAI